MINAVQTVQTMVLGIDEVQTVTTTCQNVIPEIQTVTTTTTDVDEIQVVTTYGTDQVCACCMYREHCVDCLSAFHGVPRLCPVSVPDFLPQPQFVMYTSLQNEVQSVRTSLVQINEVQVITTSANYAPEIQTVSYSTSLVTSNVFSLAFITLGSSYCNLCTATPGTYTAAGIEPTQAVPGHPATDGNDLGTLIKGACRVQCAAVHACMPSRFCLCVMCVFAAALAPFCSVGPCVTTSVSSNAGTITWSITFTNIPGNVPQLVQVLPSTVAINIATPTDGNQLGGSFKLSFNDLNGAPAGLSGGATSFGNDITSSIAWNAPDASGTNSVEFIFSALSNIGSTAVTVVRTGPTLEGGYQWTVTFNQVCAVVCARLPVCVC